MHVLRQLRATVKLLSTVTVTSQNLQRGEAIAHWL